MKILLINGSPRGDGSNSLRLAKSFARGVGTDMAETEVITVKDMDIKSCRGCFACWNKTPGSCVIKDDMQEILQKIMWADIIVWSFGLYYFNVPGKLKMLIDRQLPLVLPFMTKESESGGHQSRFDMSGKRHVVISTCGFYTAEGNYNSVIAMFDHFFGKDGYEKIFCGQGELFRVEELNSRTQEYLDSVEQAGAEFAHGGISDETRQKLNEMLYPRDAFEAMADASWGIDKETGVSESPAYVFTKQMSALYNKSSYSGRDLVLEMHYTDVEETYQIIMKQNGCEVIKDNFTEFTTKIETPFTVWKSISKGEISGSQAMYEKLYRIEGDFDLMLNWERYFGTGIPQKSEKKNSEKSPTFMLVLAPWIAFWVSVPIDTFTGAAVSIAVCALIGLMCLKNKKTVYDTVSSAAVTGFSLLLMVFPALTAEAVSLSYFSFGAMWCLSCLSKIPLTAWYSMKGYNGETALENPLFVRTNRILTLIWGVLYLATGVWTYFLMRSDFSAYIGLINNILPIAMGVFTAFFQKWYPPYFASK